MTNPDSHKQQNATLPASHAPPAGQPPRPVSARGTSAAPGPAWSTPWVQIKYITFNPALYPAMIKGASPDAKAGDLVTVYDKEGQRFGAGLYNPKGRVPLRVLHHGMEPFGEDDLLERLDRAVALRLDTLKLPNVTDAFRVVHSDGDGLSGLNVDKFADLLSVEVHSLGVWQRLPQWLPRLHDKLGTKREWRQVDERIARLEGMPRPRGADTALRPVRIREQGVRFEVDFATGHKTGFFCDQRDNRLRLARLVGRDTRLLDLCCYTGGFAIAAASLAGTRDVTGVDLDETAIAQARRNAHLNQARVNWVHCDAYSYARQMQRNGEQWDAVVIDPPKLVESRDDAREGQRKYEDLNALALTLVKPGGLLVTCSCSGLVSMGAFEQFVIRAAHRQDRRLQFLDRTGAGPDHPVMSNALEGRYLQVLWARVW